MGPQAPLPLLFIYTTTLQESVKERDFPRVARPFFRALFRVFSACFPCFSARFPRFPRFPRAAENTRKTRKTRGKHAEWALNGSGGPRQRYLIYSIKPTGVPHHSLYATDPPLAPYAPPFSTLMPPGWFCMYRGVPQVRPNRPRQKFSYTL